MKLFTITMSCLASALLIAAFIYLVKPGTGVATFDMQRVKGQFIHQLALHNASRDVVNTSSTAFKQKLQQVLDTYAREKQIVILNSQQVLSSGKDVTEDIIPRLANAMRGSS